MIALRWRYLAISLLCAACAFAANAADNEAAIKEFGTEKSEPISSNVFFFWLGKYVEAPYVVERRGLDVFVNGQLVWKGEEWPPFNYIVNEDPGDPPLDQSPFGDPPGQDVRNGYWRRKQRYLMQHYNDRIAGQKLFDAYAKSPFVKAINWDDEQREVFTFSDGNGREFGIQTYNGNDDGPSKWAEPDKPKMLDTATYQMARLVGVFGAQEVAVCSFYPTMEDSVVAGRAINLLKILSSSIGAKEKAVALVKAGLCPDEKAARVLAGVFQPNAQLSSRLAVIAGVSLPVHENRVLRNSESTPIAATNAKGAEGTPRWPIAAGAALGLGVIFFAIARRRRFSLLLSVFCLVALPASAADNEAAIKEFGVEKSEPISSDVFFFWLGKYVEAPYVVERRGLDVFVNGHMVWKGEDWPPFNYIVDEDPGDPPLDESPFEQTPGTDSRKGYWTQKDHYLTQHYGDKRAGELLFEAYAKSRFVRSVQWDDKKDGFWLENLAGARGYVQTDFGHDAPTKEAKPDNNATLETAKYRMMRFVNTLEAQGVAVCSYYPIMQDTVRADRAISLLKILTSASSAEEKAATLVKAGLCPDNKAARALAETYQPNTQLLSRLGVILGVPTPAQRDHVAKPIDEPLAQNGAPQPEPLTRINVSGRADQAARWPIVAAGAFVMVVLIFIITRRRTATTRPSAIAAIAGRLPSGSVLAVMSSGDAPPAQPPANKPPRK